MEKTYAPISIKSLDTQYGKILKLGIKAEDFITFLQENINDKGYVNVDILERKETGKYGETHYAVLNTYKKKDDDDLGF